MRLLDFNVFFYCKRAPLIFRFYNVMYIEVMVSECEGVGRGYVQWVIGPQGTWHTGHVAQGMWHVLDPWLNLVEHRASDTSLFIGIH